MPILLKPLKNKGFTSFSLSAASKRFQLIMHTSPEIADKYDEYFESLIMNCRTTNVDVTYTLDKDGFTMLVKGDRSSLKGIFDTIFEEKRYPAADNPELYEEKQQLFPSLDSPKNKQEITELTQFQSQRIPPKGKILASNDSQFSKQSVRITKEPQLFGSSMSHIGEARKPHKSDRHIIKHNRSKDMDSSQRHEATMVEAFYFELARVDNPIEMIPKARSVHDPEKDYKGVMMMVKYIEGFRSLDEIYNADKRVLSQQELIEKGITSILVDAFCSMENDCRGGNIGLDENDALKRLDFGQSGWPFTAQYVLLHNLFFSDDYGVDRLGVRIKPSESFPLTERDIVNFPNIQDAKPINWPYRTQFEKETKQHENMAGLDGIEKNPEFIKQKYFYFLKRALLSPEIIKAIGQATISEDSSKLRQKHVDMQIKRAEQLRNMLPNIPQFREYFDKFKDEYLTQLMAEATAYNEQFKAKPGQKDVISIDGVNYKAKYKDRLIYRDNLSTMFAQMVTASGPKNLS